MGKRKRDAIAEWIERQEHINVPGYWSKNWARFYPPFKISRKGTIASIVIGTLTLLVMNTAFALSLASRDFDSIEIVGIIVLVIMLNSLFIPVIIHNVITLRELSRNNKRD
jgi:hypothetical protein